MEEKKIFVAGKEIDYSNFSNEKLLNLYDQLVQRQAILTKKAQKYIENGKMQDIDINNIEV